LSSIKGCCVVSDACEKVEVMKAAGVASMDRTSFGALQGMIALGIRDWLARFDSGFGGANSMRFI
jgi:hypothetical protein